MRVSKLHFVQTARLAMQCLKGARSVSPFRRVWWFRSRTMSTASAWAGFTFLFALLSFSSVARTEELSEYRLKAAFLYNFALFTQWPAEVGDMLNLCIVGRDPFGPEIDDLQGKPVGERSIVVLRKGAGDSLKTCHVAFIAAATPGNLTRALDELRERAVLTVADSPAAARQGVALNMSVVNNKVTFEANLQAARAGRISLSSKLLRLATEVRQ